MSRAIKVKSGSVQLRLECDGTDYLVDVWSMGDRWKYTARPVKLMRNVAEGDRARWSEARTAAFRGCVKHAKESNGKAG